MPGLPHPLCPVAGALCVPSSIRVHALRSYGPLLVWLVMGYGSGDSHDRYV